jgi:hypothetical protein
MKPSHVMGRGTQLEPGTIALKVEMLVTGLTRESVAKRAQLAVGTVANILCDNNRSRGNRRRIEAALGKRFWTEE